MKPIDLIMSKLPGAKLCGRGFAARCPAHEDRQASLSISEGEDGRVLLHCHAGCDAKNIVAKLGLTMRDLFSGNGHGAPAPKRGPMRTTYRYLDANGGLVFEAIREDWSDGKRFLYRRPVSGLGDRWEYNLDGIESRPLYRLPEVLQADPGATVFVLEGEKCAELAAGLGLLAVTSAGGANAPGKTEWAPLAGRSVVIIPDNDNAGKNYAEKVVRTLYERSTNSKVKIVELPDLPPCGDLEQWLESRPGQTPEQLRKELDALIAAAPEWKPARNEKTNSTADRLLRITKGLATFFHDSSGEGYASVCNVPGGPVMNYRIESRAFRKWLSRLLWEDSDKAPSSEALTNLCNLFSAKACFDSPCLPVAVRLAGHDGRVYLDLADDEWRVVVIHADGWRVIPQSECPIRFIRPRGVLPLPVPERGGSVNDLRRFVNVKSDADFVLMVSWLLAALEPTGPYPVLLVSGEQGSAKSSLCRMLRRLVDTNVSELRAEPKEPRDLMIAASNGWVVGLDNMSHVQNWLSDSLCRLATGGGFACRQLYSDAEETLFDSKRPIIINGITDDFATRSDLLDRAIPLRLDPIPEDGRLTEGRLWKQFDVARPKVLGALLDAVSAGLKHRDTVKLSRLPRMADFAIWVTACERGLGWADGAFMAAYDRSRTEANASAIEASPVGSAVVKLMENRLLWRGTALELLKELENQADERAKRLENWPKTPRALTAALQRVAPNLRKVGVEYQKPTETGHDKRRVLQFRVVGAQCPACPAQPAIPEITAHSCGDVCGDVSGQHTRNVPQRPATYPHEIALFEAETPIAGHAGHAGCCPPDPRKPETGNGTLPETVPF